MTRPGDLPETQGCVAVRHYERWTAPEELALYGPDAGLTAVVVDGTDVSTDPRPLADLFRAAWGADVTTVWLHDEDGTAGTVRHFDEPDADGAP